MTIVLAGDIGGTKTILRLVRQTGSAMGGADLSLETLYEYQYPSRSFPDLVPMVEQFLQAAGGDAPERGCFAIAGPVVNHSSRLTNLGWELECPRLAKDLQLAHVELINDFAAVGYGVLGLHETDLSVLQPGKLDTAAPIAVIGAGTGLGQGFLVHHPHGYQVYGSEGGHADFAPRSELEFALLGYLREKHSIGRISVERVVSGQGIVSIYQFLRDRGVAEESPDVSEVVREWEHQIGRREKTVEPAATIAAAALADRDRLSVQTLHLFVEAYGAEAGNLALKLLPYGGLYIAGGIAAKILPLMQDGRFMHAFLDKGRMREVLEQVPVSVVVNPQVGLIGAAICATQI